VSPRYSWVLSSFNAKPSAQELIAILGSPFAIGSLRARLDRKCLMAVCDPLIVKSQCFQSSIDFETIRRIH
jgi:hypothetical protein